MLNLHNVLINEYSICERERIWTICKCIIYENSLLGDNRQVMSCRLTVYVDDLLEFDSVSGVTNQLFICTHSNQDYLDNKIETV